MHLTLVRKEMTPDSTIGRLYMDGMFQCYILEDPVRERAGVPVEEWKIKGHTAIPRGTYRVIITMSARFGRETPQLLDVPGFSGIRIHPGNHAGNTEGCLLPGLTKSPDWVGKSTLAYNVLIDKIRQALERGEDVEITIE